jgi:hypothetical protein
MGSISQIDHGDWLSWLKANTSVSKRTAQVYMKLARELPKSAVTADLTLDGAMKLLSAPEDDSKSAPKGDRKRPAGHKSAASPKAVDGEVLPPEPVSPNLLTNENLVDRVMYYTEAALQRKLDLTNLCYLLPGLPALDEQTSVPPPFERPTDPEAAIDQSSSAAPDGINTINGIREAGPADDTDELDVPYGPLTGREWMALSEWVEIHDPQRGPEEHKLGDPQYRPEFLRLVEFFHVPFARWWNRIRAENALEPCLPREDDTDSAEDVA